MIESNVHVSNINSIHSVTISAPAVVPVILILDYNMELQSSRASPPCLLYPVRYDQYAVRYDIDVPQQQ